MRTREGMRFACSSRAILLALSEVTFNRRGNKGVPSAMKNLSYTQSYRDLVRSASTGSSWITWMTSGAAMICDKSELLVEHGRAC